MSDQPDFLTACLEEIALEGLDGITLNALWVRLNSTRPTFPLKIDDGTKAYLWRVVAAQPGLSFHVLPEPRDPLIIYNRFQYTDSDTGICIEKDDVPEDIYPVDIIKDGDIVGSCATYNTRNEVTSKVRNADSMVLVTLDEVLEWWGEKLVIVACQEMRQTALYGLEVDPSLRLTEKQYCLLERIGRSRWFGEVTQGQNSLQVFKEPSKSLFYLRKVLQRHNLITMQVFNQKRLRGNNAVGKCIHLRRFFVERKPIYLGWLEILSQRLNLKPNKREVLSVIRSEMGLRDASFKKLYQLGAKNVKTELIPYRVFYPEATEDEFLIKTKSKERYVRILTLMKPYTYSLAGLADEDDDPQSSDEEDTKDQQIEPWEQVVELPFLHQAYRFVRARGERGTTQIQMSRALGIGKLESRLMARNLERRNVVQKILQDRGKQRVQMFVVNDWMATSALHKKLEGEKLKILAFSQAKQEALESSFSATPQGSPSGTPASSHPSSPSASTSQRSKPNEPLLLPLIDSDTQTEKFHHKKKGAHVTYRLLKRANLVLKAVKEAQLVDNIYHIQKKIIDEEQIEGLKSRLDKKSLVRLIERLAREGQIKSIKTLIKFGTDQKELHFLCDPSISASDPIVTSAIEAAKLRQMALSKELSREMITKAKGSQEEPSLVSCDVNRPNYALLKSQFKMEDMDYDPEAGRRYGHVPRMRRCQLVQELLWYLVYGFEQEKKDCQSDEPGSVVKEGDAELTLDQDNLTQLNKEKVRDESTWRRFIPPLPRHKGYPDGWCLIGDVLLRLPVSIFCQIIRVNFRIAGLAEILKNKDKRYMTVSQLPSLMRQQLMIERKYIFTFFEICTCLCQMGLLSFGRREWKDKEQIFIYVHQKATVIDTTMTEVPADQRTIQEFELSTKSYVQNYWFSLQWICLNTPPDAISTAPISASEAGGISKTPTTPVRFQEALAGKLPSEIIDEGTIPGNQRGAGGLDSIFWAHLRRNWSYVSSDVKMETLVSEGKRKLLYSGTHVAKKRVRKASVSLASTTLPKPQFPGDLHGSKYKAVRKAMLKKGTAGAQQGAASSQGTDQGGPCSSGTKGVRKIIVEGAKPMRGGPKRKAHKPPAALPPVIKKRKVESKPKKKNDLDEVDRAALRRMTKDRVGWTPQEDSLLLLCEVANTFMVGQRRDFIVPFSTVRDLMHENFVTSQDKTSKACQRRLRYILKNPQTRNNVNLYKGEALQDKSLVEEFRRGKKYVRSHHCHAGNTGVFLDLIHRLREKFKAPKDVGAQDLPDTLEEVYQRYHVSHTPVFTKSQHQDVATERDIQFSVLHNVIHAAMVLQDKTGHAQELYQLFSEYPEELLQEVFSSMRSDGIVTKIKAPPSARGPRGPATIPKVAIGTYQMAQRYTYNWFSRYPKSIFLQSYHYLDLVGGDHKVKDLKAKGRKVKSRSSEHQAEVKESGSVIGMQEDSGCVALVVALMALRKVVFQTILPEKIVVVESSYLMRQKKHASKTQMTLEKKLHLGTASDEEEEALIEEGEKWRQNEEGRNEGAGDLALQGDEALSTKPMSTSRMSLTLTRSQYARAPLSVRMLAPQDHIVINSCDIKLCLKNRYHQAYCPQPVLSWKNEYDCHQYLKRWNSGQQWLHPKTCYRILANVRSTQPRSLDLANFFTNCPTKFTFTPSDMCVVKAIIQEAEEQGMKGLSFKEVQTKFGNVPKIEKMLGALKEYHVVEEVGVTVPRYVTHKHLQPWLIHSFKNLKGRPVHNEDPAPDPLVEDPAVDDVPTDVTGSFIPVTDTPAPPDGPQPDVPDTHQEAAPGYDNFSLPPCDENMMVLLRTSAGVLLVKKEFAQAESHEAARGRAGQTTDVAVVAASTTSATPTTSEEAMANQGTTSTQDNTAILHASVGRDTTNTENDLVGKDITNREGRPVSVHCGGTPTIQPSIYPAGTLFTKGGTGKGGGRGASEENGDFENTQGDASMDLPWTSDEKSTNGSQQPDRKGAKSGNAVDLFETPISEHQEIKVSGPSKETADNSAKLSRNESDLKTLDPSSRKARTSPGGGARSQSSTPLESPAPTMKRLLFGQTVEQLARTSLTPGSSIPGQDARSRLPQPSTEILVPKGVGQGTHVPLSPRQILETVRPQMGLVTGPSLASSGQQSENVMKSPQPYYKVGTPSMLPKAGSSTVVPQTAGPGAQVQTHPPRVTRIVSMLSTRAFPDLNKMGMTRQRSESESSSVSPGSSRELVGGRVRRSSYSSAPMSSRVLTTNVSTVPTASASGSTSPIAAQHSTLTRALLSPQLSTMLQHSGRRLSKSPSSAAEPPSPYRGSKVKQTTSLVKSSTVQDSQAQKTGPQEGFLSKALKSVCRGVGSQVSAPERASQQTGGAPSSAVSVTQLTSSSPKRNLATTLPHSFLTPSPAKAAPTGQRISPTANLVILKSPPAKAKSPVRQTEPVSNISTLNPVQGQILLPAPGMTYQLVTIKSPSGQPPVISAGSSPRGSQVSTPGTVVPGSPAVNITGLRQSFLASSPCLQSVPVLSSPAKPGVVIQMQTRPQVPSSQKLPVHTVYSPLKVPGDHVATNIRIPQGSKTIGKPTLQGTDQGSGKTSKLTSSDTSSGKPKTGTLKEPSAVRTPVVDKPTISSPAMLSFLRAPPLYSPPAPTPPPLTPLLPSTLGQQAQAPLVMSPLQKALVSPPRPQISAKSEVAPKQQRTPGKGRGKRSRVGDPKDPHTEVLKTMTGSISSLAGRGGKSITIGTRLAAVGSSLSVEAAPEPGAVAKLSQDRRAGSTSTTSLRTATGEVHARKSHDKEQGGVASIVVPLSSIDGVEGVQHLLNQASKEEPSSSGTVRIQLPPGMAMPTANQPIKISVITPDEARLLGLPMPAAGPTTIRVHQEAGHVLPPLQSAAMGSTVGMTTTSNKQPQQKEIKTNTDKDPPGGSDQEKEKEGCIPQVDGTADEKTTKEQGKAGATGNPQSQETNETTSTEGHQGDLQEKPDKSEKDQAISEHASQKGEGDATEGNVEQTPTPTDVAGGEKRSELPLQEQLEDSSKEIMVDPPKEACTSQPIVRVKHQRERVSMNQKDGRAGTNVNSLYQRVRLVPRPWRTTDGTVNRPTMKLMLEAVLIWIMSHPGITQETLVAKYNPILQPVPVGELIQILEELGCITVDTVMESHPSSLFSTRSAFLCGTKYSGIENLVYTPRVDCILQLGQFESQLVGTAKS